MGTVYTQLSLRERRRIEDWWHAKVPVREMACPEALEDDPAVLKMIETVIREAKRSGRKIGFCGQAPSNDPAYARHLVRYGIDTISVTPDSFVQVLRNVAEAEASDPDQPGGKLDQD